MTKKHLTLILTLTGFGSLPASARVIGTTGLLLSGSIHALQSAGFSGLQEVRVPASSPSTLPSVINPQTDHEKEMLGAYAKQLLASTPVKPGLEGPSARALGFKPIPKTFEWYEDGTMPIRCQAAKKKATEEEWAFAVTDARGRTEIILSYLDKDNVLTSYLTSPSGVLAKAVADGGVAKEIPLEKAQQGFRAQLDFWTTYYGKHPKLTAAEKN